jgi:hypothetical protein
LNRQAACIVVPINSSEIAILGGRRTYDYRTDCHVFNVVKRIYRDTSGENPNVFYETKEGEKIRENRMHMMAFPRSNFHHLTGREIQHRFIANGNMAVLVNADTIVAVADIRQGQSTLVEFTISTGKLRILDFLDPPISHCV